MTLTKEWRQRIEGWRDELARQIYRSIGIINFEGFITKEHLSLDEVKRQKFDTIPVGTNWGHRWEYGWFRGIITLPPESEGQRIVIHINVGNEGLVFIDGIPMGARDHHHHDIVLTQNAKKNTTYECYIECYAGDNPKNCHAGPVSPGRQPNPDPIGTQKVVEESTFGIWEEDIYQLWIDIKTLLELRDSIDQDSLRVTEIDEGLREFTRIVDLEVPFEELLPNVRDARTRLQPLLQCVNGSTTPILYAFGHGHLDVAWLWPLAETERKIARTFSNQLALIEQYPHYRFLSSQAHLYRMAQEHYPDLYDKIADAVKQGNIIAEGGMWVEADTNITSGESLIRQFIHGKRFFREQFGVTNEMLWLPDVFGYSGTLPQIMKGCGINYFATAKIFWNYHGGDPFPHNTFMWEGIDGSQVLVHLCNDYNSQTSPSHAISRWKQLRQKDGIRSRLFPFGWGDGGGGPKRDHLEFINREKNLEGMPCIRIASPIDYFKDLEQSGIPDVTYVGELYYQCHRGTYTSQAKTKKGNRKSEFALREAELWYVAARAINNYSVDVKMLDESWKMVLLNQFHDILPGSSISRVYEEAEAAYDTIQRNANEIIQGACCHLVDSTSDTLTVFNSLSWPRKALVQIPESWEGIASRKGEPLRTQKIDDKMYAEVTVPSCGWTSVQKSSEKMSADSDMNATETTIENNVIRISINEYGELTSVFDKESNREWCAGTANSIRMYKDVPSVFDAWDIDSMYEQTPVALTEKASISVITSGPLVAIVRIQRLLNTSPMTQEIILHHNSRRIDFKTAIDWKESHKLLKVNFPCSIYSHDALHEIQFGHIARPNHKSRPFDEDRFEVSSHKWTAIIENNRGCAVLNDCKYGVNVNKNSINLTLLKSAMAPDTSADKGIQEFTYAFYAWNDSFVSSDLIRQGYDLNCPVVTIRGATQERSLFSVDSDRIIIETIKPAEDGTKDILVRMYESKRTSTRCTISTCLPFRKAVETNMLEEKIEECELGASGVTLEFGPFEIKTIRFSF